MLRNCLRGREASRLAFLNEVLSLNAQEFPFFRVMPSASTFLNEVLSLNAQESYCDAKVATFSSRPQ